MTWDLNEGIEYAELRPLPERLQAGEDVADFTDVVELIDELRGRSM